MSLLVRTSADAGPGGHRTALFFLYGLDMAVQQLADQLAVKVVCHTLGREIGERAQPTLGSTEGPYYGTFFFVSENAAWPTTATAAAAAVFSAISEHSF